MNLTFKYFETLHLQFIVLNEEQFYVSDDEKLNIKERQFGSNKAVEVRSGWKIFESF